MIDLRNSIRNKVGSSFISLAILLVIATADATMAYTVPVFLNEYLKDTFLVGLVFSTSSFMGFLFDLYSGSFFKSKTYKFFIFYTALLAIAFPLILLTAKEQLIFYILAMGVWGIYFETKSFSIYNYIKQTVPRVSYPFAWGAVDNINSIAYLSGPLIASYFIIKSIHHPLYIALILFITGFILTNLFLRGTKKKQEHKVDQTNLPTKEFKVWEIITQRVWMIWILWFLLWCIDASVWSVGILLAEKLKVIYPQAEYLVPLYMLPKIFMGFSVTKLEKFSGKKHLAMIASIAGGVALIFLGIFKDINLILGMLFLGAMGFAISITALEATFEEYIDRLKKYGSELIGLEQTAGSLGYVISPIVSCWIAANYKEQTAFMFWGTLIAIWAIITLIFVPRKIRMPQKDLKKIAKK